MNRLLIVMGRSLFVVIATLFLVGCHGQERAYPPARLFIDNTHLSFVTPADWFRSKIPGSEFLTVFTDVHYDIKPNIQLELYTETPEPDEAVASFFKRKQSMYPNYTIRNETPFKTESGLTVRKITAQRENDRNISINHLHYVFSSKNEVYILTGTCAEPGIEIYGDIFDQAMKSVEIRN